MSISEAIQKAIEGGLGEKIGAKIFEGSIYTFGERIVESKLFLDRDFWQCLGKAMGDGKTKMGYSSVSANVDKHGQLLERWLWRWHCFIDHLASGGTPESYFGTLG